jgi:xylitol oxidase
MISANWAGNYEYLSSGLATPGSVEELQEIVARSPRVKALGSRHSFNDVADTAGIQVSLNGLPRTVTIDEAARTVTVNGGGKYGEFVEELADAGWAIHNLASLPHISVAGAIATGTHGSGDRNGSLGTAVAALDLVTATGEITRAKRGDPDFDGLVVSLGALGVVSSVSLDIEPSFDVRQDVFENLAWPQLLAHFDELTSSAYSVSAFTDWGDDGASQVWLKSRIDSDVSAATRSELFGATRATSQRHPLPGGPSEWTTEQGGVSGPWWKRLAHFKLEFTPSNGAELQTEYLVPREHATGAIEAMRRLGPLMAPLLFISELRTMAADELWLSPSFGHDSLGLHFTWKQDAAVHELLPALDEALAPFAARPHWGKLFATDVSRLDSLYPRLPDFRRLAGRLDPNGKFRNDFLDHTIFAG